MHCLPFPTVLAAVLNTIRDLCGANFQEIPALCTELKSSAMGEEKLQ